MKTLNLVYPENSDIKYKVSKFPDGQQNITIEGFWVHHQETRTNSGESELHKVGSSIFNIHFGNSVQIKSRLNNWLDLELITCSVASLRELGVEEIHLYVPYIEGARSDRKFEEGGNNYLKDVLCPIINSLNFKTVTCIDPHSDCLEMGIKGFRRESNLNLVYFTMNQLRPLGIADDYLLISPDAGASKKIYKLAEQIGYKGDIITCSKDRDENGKLTRTVVPNIFDYLMENKDFIIIDDICDGGATFINIVKEILDEQENNPQFAGRRKELNSKIYLIATHGIFSNGYTTLSEYFDGIYCTNSYKDITAKYAMDADIVKQLNIF